MHFEIPEVFLKYAVVECKFEGMKVFHSVYGRGVRVPFSNRMDLPNAGNELTDMFSTWLASSDG